MFRSSSTSSSSANRPPADGYHPDRSRVAPAAMADWLRAPLSGRLTDVPGIGPATERALQAVEVDTSYALLGQFFCMKRAGVQPVEHLDRFHYWLTSVGVAPGYRAGICAAIAEKAALLVPDIYDPAVYDDTSAAMEVVAAAGPAARGCASK